MRCWRRRARFLISFHGYGIYYRNHVVLGKPRKTYFVYWTDHHLEQSFESPAYRNVYAALLYIHKHMNREQWPK